MWVKYTLLRIRIDHMLAFNWKFLTPLAFVLLMVTALMNALLAGTPTWLYISGMFLSNVLLAWVALEIARSYSRKEREKVEGPKPVVEASYITLQTERDMNMTGEQIIFLIVALVTLGSGLMVVTTRNLVHAALWLVATLFGVAVVYALLNAGFLAVVQVVVYIGAIAILFIFAVMLTRKDMRDQGPQMNKTWWFGALLAVLTFGGLFFLLQGWSGFSKTAAAIPSGFDAVASWVMKLTSPNAYVLPFEVASVLLVAALVGAVYVAFNRQIGGAHMVPLSWYLIFAAALFSIGLFGVLSRSECGCDLAWH